MQSQDAAHHSRRNTRDRVDTAQKVKQSTSPAAASPVAEVLQPPRDAPEAFPVHDRLTYLHALYPYAGIDDLSAILLHSETTEEAAARAYDILNPDYNGLPFLQEQWSLARDKHVPAAVRAAAFGGVGGALEERASDVFRNGSYAGLSQMQEYEYTVRTFPVDTSTWDARILHRHRHVEQLASMSLPLAGRPEVTPPHAHLFSGAEAPQTPKRSGATAAAELLSSSPPLHADAVKQCDVVGTENALVAPVIRWAPVALRAGENVLREHRRHVFRTFDEATFFASPLMSASNSALDEGMAGEQHTKPTAATGAQPTAAAEADPAEQVVHEPFAEPPQRLSLSSHLNEREPVHEVAEEHATAHVSSPGSPSRTLGPKAASKASLTNDLYEQAQTTLEVRRKRREPSDFLRERVKHLRPLGNMVFDSFAGQLQNIRRTVASTRNDADAEEVARDTTGVAPLSTAELCEAGFAASSFGAEEDSFTAAPSPVVFLTQEENRWEFIQQLLSPYNGIFDGRGRCDLVQQLYTNCAGFVANINEIFSRLLSVISQEAAGRTVMEPVAEHPLDIPMLGSKLFSCAALRVRELVFNGDKSSLQFYNGGGQIKLKLRIKRLYFEPMTFAYIDEGKATKQVRLYNSVLHEQSRRSVDSKARMSKAERKYAKHVTRGDVTIKIRNIRMTLVGSVLLYSTGKVYLIVSEVDASIGQLRLSTDVKKLNVLTTLFNGAIKSMLEAQIKDKVMGAHVFH